MVKTKKAKKEIELEITYFAYEDKTIKAEGIIKLLEMKRIGSFVVVNSTNESVCVVLDNDYKTYMDAYKESIVEHVLEYAKTILET